MEGEEGCRLPGAGDAGDIREDMGEEEAMEERMAARLRFAISLARALEAARNAPTAVATPWAEAGAAALLPLLPLLLMVEVEAGLPPAAAKVSRHVSASGATTAPPAVPSNACSSTSNGGAQAVLDPPAKSDTPTAVDCAAGCTASGRGVPHTCSTVGVWPAASAVRSWIAAVTPGLATAAFQAAPPTGVHHNGSCSAAAVP